MQAQSICFGSLCGRDVTKYEQQDQQQEATQHHIRLVEG